MLAGFYTIASGVLTHQREVDTIGENLINLQTPGYRGQRLVSSSFDQELLLRQENGQTVLADSAAVTAIVDDVLDLFTPGSFYETGLETDLAIAGEGFFNIRNDAGTFLTRNGSFQIDAQGYLALAGLGRVLGASGQPIQVGQSGFKVDGDGNVFNRDGVLIDRLQITVPQQNATFERQNNGMFQIIQGGQQNAQNFQLIQYGLESSNVDMTMEMTYLTQAQHAFQTCSSALQIVDGMNQKASQIAQI